VRKKWEKRLVAKSDYLSWNCRVLLDENNNFYFGDEYAFASGTSYGMDYWN
jgi:hypothetical protein